MITTQHGRGATHVSGEPPVVITGGAGFIGTNLASRLLSSGRRVRILDSLARPGVEHNLEWLNRQYPQLLEVVVGDVREAAVVQRVVADAGEVYHLAAQVAVTSSLDSPLHDFDVNARGTLVLLEAVRRLPHRPPLLFTSTNKVYGALHDVELLREAHRYQPLDHALRASGLDESRPLDLHSPYGCSKGCADQYVLDYARCFGVRSVVFRMSCIFGPHQRGTEDQGWVAHFLLKARAGEPITVYGDGLQVRDLLYVDDLLDAFALAMKCAESHPGRVYNMGGGADNTFSLREVLDLLHERHGLMPKVQMADGRIGDQRYFVSDTSRFRHDTGWAPRVSATEGLGRLLEWFELRDRSETMRAAPRAPKPGAARDDSRHATVYTAPGGTTAEASP